MRFLFLIFIFFISFPDSFAQTIKVNQQGYRIGYPKYAWVNDLPAGEFTWFVKSTLYFDRVYYSAITKASEITDKATGEKVTLLDFSSMDIPGNYYIQIKGAGISLEFPVTDTPFKDAWCAGVKSYYYQRSGIDLDPVYAGIWARKAAHTRDAVDYAGFENGKIKEGAKRSASGGWYDAGDFGKKIIPASVAFYPILKLADLYPKVVENTTIQIPNPYKGLPDMLAEAKWELDWFFKMQDPDGSVHHQIVSPQFFMGPVTKDTFPRYTMPVSATATADFVATMAMACRAFSRYLPAYADSCLRAAENAWNYLRLHPETFPAGGYRDPLGINKTGAYEDPVDKDERLWAAAELFNTTGKQEYNDYFEKHYREFNLTSFGWWYDPHNYAFYSWLGADQPGKSRQTEAVITQMVKRYADSISAESAKNAYGAILSPYEYVWGSNSYIANYGMELLIINSLLKTDKYTAAALHQLNYLLGCNSLDLSFVSGVGARSVHDPHQSINSYDQLLLAPPGFIPGGPNAFKQDPYVTELIEKKHPAPAKCYVDFHWSYATNEVCIPYNSGFVFLAGWFLQ